MKAYLEMLPRIEAGEILNSAAAMALGSGSLKKGDAQRLKSSLERRAHRGSLKAPKADAATLSMMGIGVEVSDG